MIKTRKSIFWLLIVVFILGGCSSSSSNPEQKTLTLWYWNRALDDKLIQAVQTQFPDVRINAQKIGGDFKSKLKTTLAGGGSGPDIVAFNDWVTELFPSSDHFYDLYELGAKDIEPDYLDWKWQLGVTPEGKMIAMPIDTGPTALFYREDLFSKAGLPTDPEEVHKQMGTWEDYFKAGQKLQQAFGGKVKLTDSISNIYSQVNAQSDKIYFDKNDNFIGESPDSSMKKAWDLAVQASQMGVLANTNMFSSEWNASMNNGKIASFVSAVWHKQILMDAAPDTAGKWRVARAPGGDGNVGGSFLAIMKTSKYPKESFEVMKWLLNSENQVTAFKDINLFPSATKALDAPVMKEKEDFFGGQSTGEIFTESARNVKPAYFGSKFGNVNGIVSRELQSVALGKDPDTAWNDALKRVKKELLR
ncbi:ABC transporter substrate-binding protein [Paenibacillus sp. KQZ6P-2]|uniref:ABC transporter substrate-binding protein n=1 Tax=Paenibacillus mangrovi TaxID=2931978 RepID=A0A9X2B7D8_9BACL|nr:ABC transporter substrate-binding protein [Paenibacillus mangrovi]MCJ8014837.1 ABC transporter substrate-binding protein [Paenibacillus mangrovi]